MGAARSYRIVTIAGDGIGPELLDATMTVLRAVTDRDADLALDFEAVPGGAAHHLATGSALSDEGFAACAAADAVLKAPVGLPGVRHPDGTEAGTLGGLLRAQLDLFANVRPIRLWPGVEAPLRDPGVIDYTIVRENTEGLYASRGGGIVRHDAATDTMLLTRHGSERVIRFAFELAQRGTGAPADGRRRVTCAEKSNVLRSYAFFVGIFRDIASEFPDVEAETMYADAVGQSIVMEPGRFDVLLTENFVGDILSDVAAATVGGVGMCGSGNIGEGTPYFEPLHGSAPGLAGTDRANPLSQILAAAMMLDHLGEQPAAAAIRSAVENVLGSGALRIDTDGCAAGGTRGAAHAVAAAL